jgi:hypothetical protein
VPYVVCINSNIRVSDYGACRHSRAPRLGRRSGADAQVLVYSRRRSTSVSWRTTACRSPSRRPRRARTLSAQGARSGSLTEPAQKIVLNRRSCCCSHTHKDDCRASDHARHQVQRAGLPLPLSVVLSRACIVKVDTAQCDCGQARDAIHEPGCAWKTGAVDMCAAQDRIHLDGRTALLSPLSGVASEAVAVHARKLTGQRPTVELRERDACALLRFADADTAAIFIAEHQKKTRAGGDENPTLRQAQASRMRFCCCSPELPHDER